MGFLTRLFIGKNRESLLIGQNRDSKIVRAANRNLGRRERGHMMAPVRKSLREEMIGTPKMARHKKDRNP